VQFTPKKYLSNKTIDNGNLFIKKNAQKYILKIKYPSTKTAEGHFIIYQKNGLEIRNDSSIPP
jgi:hypothetical protein